MKKMSLHDALSRVGNPRLRRGGAKLSASARDLIDAGGLGRVANKGKKKAGKKKAATAKKSAKSKSKSKSKSKAKSKSKSKAKSTAKRSGKSKARKVTYAQAHAAGAGSPEMKAYMAGIRGKKGKGKAKSKKKSKRAANPSARVRRAHAAHAGRVHNGRKRRVRRHRAHARRHNPGFDVKATLIQTGLIVAGAFVAARLAPIVGDGLAKIGFLKENPKFIGYAHLAAGALVAVAGDYLQERFGGKIGFDVRPAAIAAGAVLAYDGLKRADLVPASGTFALTGPAAGTFALTGPSPAMSGALVLPNLQDPNAMLGTYGYEDYGMGATVLANLAESNAMLGSIFDDSDSSHDSLHMNGTVFTAAELPVPVVAPHSVMQGNQVTVPQMC